MVKSSILVILYSLILALGYFLLGNSIITGLNPNVSYIIILILLVGTIFTATRIQALKFPRFKTIFINLFLVAGLFCAFYIGLRSVEMPEGAARHYYLKE